MSHIIPVNQTGTARLVSELYVQPYSSKEI
jgi:hypothetical protein